MPAARSFCCCQRFSLWARNGVVHYARREQKKTAFTLVEGLLFGAILIAAAVGLYSLTAGTISM
jgi:hypothetical protein